MGLDDAPHVLVTSREEWRAWLEANHGTATGVWAVTFRAGADGPRVPYADLVEEALCFGWIDSRPGKVDARRTRLWLAPRKPGSGWSRLNKERVARLEQRGAISEAGRRVIEAAKADGSWSALDEIEALVVPGDLHAALDDRPPARERWESFSPSARKGILQWIASARRPETRAARVEETAVLAARGEKANQWRPRR